MRTQAEINALLDQLMATYDGQRPDYWGYAGECLSYNKRWIDTLRNGYVGGPMSAPPAPNGYGSSYWISPPGAVSELFSKEAYDPNRQYPRGSMFTWSGSGHIGILLDNQPGAPTALVSHQNADPDGSPVHTSQRSKARIDGILIIRVAAPAPVAPAAPQPPYTVIETYPGGKLIRLNKPANLWGMNYREFEYMASHPVEAHAAGEVWTVTNKVAHVNGHHYYRREGQVDGFNVADCDDYTPPPPAPPRPIPQLYNYTVITRVMRFTSATDALHHQNVSGDIEAGEYIVISKQDNAYNLSDDNMKDRGWWVNTADNVIAPIPDLTPVPQQDTDIVHPEVEPVDMGIPTIPADAPKIVTRSLRPDGAVVLYRATNMHPVEIRDYQSGQATITMQPYNYSSATGKNELVPLVATFVVDGSEYGLTQKVKKLGFLYGVPMDICELYVPVPATEPTEAIVLPTRTHLSPLDHNADGKVDLRDFTDGIGDFIDFTGKWFKDVSTTIIPKATVSKQRIGKAIDGFTARKKK